MSREIWTHNISVYQGTQGAKAGRSATAETRKLDQVDYGIEDARRETLWVDTSGHPQNLIQIHSYRALARYKCVLSESEAIRLGGREGVFIPLHSTHAKV